MLHSAQPNKCSRRLSPVIVCFNGLGLMNLPKKHLPFHQVKCLFGVPESKEAVLARAISQRVYKRLEPPLQRPKLGDLNNGNVFPHSSGSYKSEISASVGLVFFSGLPLGL